MSLAGRTALVTGGGVRIGAYICRRLAAEGCHVVVHHNRSVAEAEALAASIRDEGGHASCVQADLADDEQLEGLLEAADASGGEVTLLVNNAAIFPKSRFGDVDRQALEEAVRVNAWAPLRLIQQMAGRDAAVVNLLDTRLVDLDPTHYAYHLSKAMLDTVTRTAARALAPGVRVNGVAPGPVLEAVGTSDSGYLERIAKVLPLRRTPPPEEIAEAVLHFLQATSVTGQILHVDGGRHMGRPIEEPRR